MKYKYKRPIRSPRDGAKDLIRRDMVEKNGINLLLRKDQRKKTDDFSAHIDADRKTIVITQFFGVDIHEEYYISEIMKDILEEVKQALHPGIKVFRPKSKYYDSF
jgi:hypothetical protein